MMWFVLNALLLCFGVSQAKVTFSLLPVDGECDKFYFTIVGYDNFKLKFSCEAGKSFSRSSKQCVMKFGRSDDCNIQQKSSVDFTVRSYVEGILKCSSTPNAVYPDASNCAGFYNCSKTDIDETGNLGKYVDECPYPGLFDPINRRCEMDYKKVEHLCGDRKLLLGPCEHKRNQCPRATCRPCHVRYPSCVGKRNGFQEWEGRSFSPYYARCEDGRTLEAGTCARSRSGSPRIFSPTQNECVDVDGKTFFGGN